MQMDVDLNADITKFTIKTKSASEGVKKSLQVSQKQGCPNFFHIHILSLDSFLFLEVNMNS